MRIKGQDNHLIQSWNALVENNEIRAFNAWAKEGQSRSAQQAVVVKLKPSSPARRSLTESAYQIVQIDRSGSNMPINKDELVVVFSGNAQEWAKSLSLGQKLNLKMEFISRTTGNEVRPRQMLTGNAWVLRNGELTYRNENEAYNNRPYPRTGIGVSADRKTMWAIVIDRSNSSKGATTAHMASLLRELGAKEATSLDGGGSAQLLFDHKIQNHPADGWERPVANGLIIWEKH